MCQVPASELQSRINHNEHVTNKLEVSVERERERERALMGRYIHLTVLH